MRAREARREIDRALVACVTMSVGLFVVLHWVVTPLILRHRWLCVPAAGLVIAALVWTHLYTNRWKRHLRWSERKALAEEAGDTITLLGLLASPDSDRPLMWPAFWFRWWGIKP